MAATRGMMATPQPTLERLPIYLNYLKARQQEGCEQISSAMIAQDLKMTGIQVRKDLAYVSSGTPKVGRSVSLLIESLEEALGYRVEKQVVLVGAGRLGQALISYEGFRHCGFRVVAAFDQDEYRVGMTMQGCRVYPASEIVTVTREMGVNYAIIAVPADQAQQACDRLVEAGVRAILNFAPGTLNVPAAVVVRNIDLAASMLSLAATLAMRDYEEPPLNPDEDMGE